MVTKVTVDFRRKETGNYLQDLFSFTSAISVILGHQNYSVYEVDNVYRMIIHANKN